MGTNRREWEEVKEFTLEYASAMSLKKYNNLLTSGRWSKNNTKYAQIIYLVGVYQKISDESMKLYENYQQYNDLRLHLCQDQDQESH